MTLRQALLVTHRWIGLTTAAILCAAGLTGTVLVWAGSSPLRHWSARLHESLGLGQSGWYLVVLAAAAAVALQLSGVFLWWKRKTIVLNVRAGWRRTLFDLHNAVGALALFVMFLLAATAVGRVAIPRLDPAHRTGNLAHIVSRLHTAEGFPTPIKILYTAGSLAFLVQGVTGVLIWWKPRS